MKLRCTFLTLVGCLSLSLATLSAAEPSQAELVAFADKLASAEERWSDSGTELGVGIGKALVGKTDDLLALYRVNRKMALLAVKLQKEADAWNVPDHPAAKEAKLAYDGYTARQRQNLLEVLPTILEWVDDGQGDADAKMTKIQAYLQKENEKELVAIRLLRGKIKSLRDAAK